MICLGGGTNCWATALVWVVVYLSSLSLSSNCIAWVLFEVCDEVDHHGKGVSKYCKWSLILTLIILQVQALTLILIVLEVQAD